jgi:hypothetical protein
MGSAEYRRHLVGVMAAARSRGRMRPGRGEARNSGRALCCGESICVMPGLVPGISLRRAKLACPGQGPVMTE